MIVTAVISMTIRVKTITTTVVLAITAFIVVTIIRVLIISTTVTVRLVIFAVLTLMMISNNTTIEPKMHT